MASTGKKWLIGCGGGCAAIIVISILALIGAGVMFKRPFDKAIDAREILDTTYGTGEDFVPPVDGLSPDRIKRFLAVRKGLEELCGDFEAIGEDFEHMEKLDSAGDEPSTGEVLKGVGNILGSVMQMPGLIGKLAVRRNELLLENEMGLGEYTWIYVLAYHSWLGYDPNTSFDDEDSGVMTRRTRHLMQSLMRNHAAALDRAGRQEEADTWRAEADRLDRSEGNGVPFAMGDLPREVVLALRPYRGKLEASFCAGMSGLDLTRVQKKGISIHAE
jgi:hypothetical protein